MISLSVGVNTTTSEVRLLAANLAKESWIMFLKTDHFGKRLCFSKENVEKWVQLQMNEINYGMLTFDQTLWCEGYPFSGSAGVG